MAKDFATSVAATPHDLGHQTTLDADDLVEHAKALPLTDGGVQTAELLSLALATDPRHHEAQLLRERLHQIFVPRWHFSMLGDEIRNAAYAHAIAATVKPGDVVLDIGCGAGLTAMLAARAGAKHVYTCEQQPLIAQAAIRVIAENGLSDRITVIPKMSHDLVVGEDLPERADVVVSEIVDTVLLGEGALATLSHAMRGLAKPNARAIPDSGTLHAQLVSSDALFRLWRPVTAEGFKIGAFHHFANLAQITPNDFSALGLAPCGPSKKLFSFDFRRPSLQPAATSLTLDVAQDCDVHAVLAYFTMELAPGIRLSNDLTSGGHWGRTAYLFDRSTHARQGEHIAITSQHDSSQLSLAIHGIVPADEAEPMPDAAYVPATVPPLVATYTT